MEDPYARLLTLLWYSCSTTQETVYLMNREQCASKDQGANPAQTTFLPGLETKLSGRVLAQHLRSPGFVCSINQTKINYTPIPVFCGPSLTVMFEHFVFYY